MAAEMTEADADAAIALALDFEQKPTLDDMIQQVNDDCWTVLCGQRARLLADMTDRPMSQQVRRIAVYTALETFLRRIRDQPAEVARRLQKRGANAAEA